MPQVLQSPLQRRSEYLAEALKQQAQPQEIRGGWGELAARLLGQALTRTAQNRTDEALGAEQYNADLGRRQRLAREVGGTIEGQAREVGNGAFDPLSGLANALRGKPAETQPQPQAVPTGPMPTNTQEPISSPIAPVAPVEGAPLPGGGQSVGQTPQQMPQQAASVAAQAPAQPQHQAPQNPLAASPQEQQLILQYLNSGDPALVAQAEKMVQDIQMRQAEPAWKRAEFQAVNGVPGTFDPTVGWRPQEGGVPQSAQNQTFVAGENNEYGAPAGTLLQRSPTGVVSVVNRPEAGYERVGGNLRAERGGPADQTSGDRGLGNVRQLRTDFRRETEPYREARSGFQKVQAAAADNTGASDVALVFGFMKTIDPGSTVREGEFATVQNTGSIPERIQGLYNRALAGERLTPAQRAEIVQAAEGQFQTYQQSYDDTVASYQGIAQQYGFDPSLVFGETVSPPAQRPQQQRQQRQQPRPQAQPQRPQGGGQRRRYNPSTGRIE